MVVIAIVFTVLCLRIREEIHPEEENSEGDDEQLSTGKMVVLLVAGLSGLVWGANLMVEGGTAIAKTYGISERIIGLTIVAIGTSLPELAVSVAAATKGYPDLAVGNVVGSCLFNLAFVLGASSLISPLQVNIDGMFWDLTAMMALTVAMWAMLKTVRARRVVKGRLPLAGAMSSLLVILQSPHLADRRVLSSAKTLQLEVFLNRLDDLDAGDEILDIIQFIHLDHQCR